MHLFQIHNKTKELHNFHPSLNPYQPLPYPHILII